MKVTDYCPRAAPFDTYLPGRGTLLPRIGAEIGVDVGAHAQAMLQYYNFDMLFLIDPWPNPYCRGYCEGRLSALGFQRRFSMIQEKSLKAVLQFDDETLDFIYIDQEHDGASVAADMQAWWPKLKREGVFGYRNYTKTITPLGSAIDAFVAANSLTPIVQTGEIIIVKP